MQLNAFFYGNVCKKYLRMCAYKETARNKPSQQSNITFTLKVLLKSPCPGLPLFNRRCDWWSP